MLLSGEWEERKEGRLALPLSLGGERERERERGKLESIPSKYFTKRGERGGRFSRI